MRRAVLPQKFESRGFTLIELMVALTGGLVFSAFVFMLAKDSTRFYQNELRLSSATQNVITGFQRLRTDIARAGYLSTPNIQRDPTRCINLSGAGVVGTPVANLAAVSIDTTTPTQHIIDLMGSYASADAFPARAILPGGTGMQVYLQPQSAAMVRLLGQRDPAEEPEVTTAALTTALLTVFRPGRLLRVIDKAGAQHFGVVDDVNTGAGPFIQLRTSPAIQTKTSATACGLRGTEAGSLVNVVQRIRYSVGTLNADDADFGVLVQGIEAAGVRTDLIRTELGWGDDTELAGAGRELVAEYAVALQFSLSVATTGNNYRISPVDGDLSAYAGSPVATAMPQHIRAVRARLAVRSAAPDRGADLPAGDDTQVAPGLYRIQVNPGGTPARFARVRTLQADIALRNQRNARW